MRLQTLAVAAAALLAWTTQGHAGAITSTTSLTAGFYLQPLRRQRRQRWSRPRNAECSLANQRGHCREWAPILERLHGLRRGRIR